MAEATWGDLMNAAKGQLELIPDGEQNVKIVDSEATQASTGALMFKVKVQIEDGPHIKRKLTTNLVVSTDNPVALAIFFRNMENMGLNADFFAANPNPGQVASAMLNRMARVNVGHKTWNGVERNEIKGWLPPASGGPGLGLPGSGGPVAPGTVIGPAGPPLPTSAVPTATPTAAPSAPSTPTATPTPPQSTVPVVGNGPTVGAGPSAPDSPPPLPI